MPFVCPIPLGGLATEIGTLNDRLQQAEAARAGNGFSFVASCAVPNTGSNTSFAEPTGAPTVTMATPAGGGVLLFAGLISGNGVRAGISIDGGSVSIMGPYNYDTSSCVWYEVLPMGLHTFTLWTAYNGTGVTATDLYLVAVPC